MNKSNFVNKRSYDFEVLIHRNFVQFIKPLKVCPSGGALFDDTNAFKALVFKAGLIKKGRV